MKMQAASSASEVISYQAKLIEAELARLLPPGTPYAVVDFPNHQNVGDSAIWLGEMALLTRLMKSKPRYVCDYYNFNADELRQCHPDGAILIHGGGNFGDIWPEHHQFREMIIASFPDRQIIQLPQTVSFKDKANSDRCARLIEQHGNVTLLVRDRVSEAYAKANLGCAVKLLPDMAFGIGLLASRATPSCDAFMLLRGDAERASYDPQPLADVPNSIQADWLDEPVNFNEVCVRKTRFSSWGRKGGTMAKGRFNLFMHLSQGRLERGLRMLSSGRVVITDRLHAHILSTLLDKPHVVLDNNYGKIFSYIDAWTHPYHHLRKASSSQEAIARYQELLKR
jgi:exopolysaccharide biosynthesis predicted pyruvyltransferase EpsI